MASAQPQDLRKGKGRRYGSKNWTINESMDFLAVVHRLKPVSPMAWELVAQEYERCRKDAYPKRTADQLQRRWKTLIKYPKPLGDRNCSDDVRLYAKRIKRVIERSWDGVELGMRDGRDESSGGEYYSDEYYSDESDDGDDDDDEVLDDEELIGCMAVVADTVRRMNDRAAQRAEDREDERRFRMEELLLEHEHLAARREDARQQREDARHREDARREEARHREDARREEANRREDARREDARHREDARQRRFIISQQQFAAAQAAQQQQQAAQQQQFFALMLAMLQRRGHGMRQRSMRPTDGVVPHPFAPE